MRANDLDNVVVPRDALVWEGLFGLYPDEKTKRLEARFRAKGKWDNAVDCYTINEMLARKIWDLTWRFNVQIELVTWWGPDFRRALEDRMDRENMPFSRIWSDNPLVLARRLAVMPDLRTIYDPDPEHQFLFGSKGRILSPDQYELLGAL